MDTSGGIVLYFGVSIYSRSVRRLRFLLFLNSRPQQDAAAVSAGHGCCSYDGNWEGILLLARAKRRTPWLRGTQLPCLEYILFAGTSWLS